MLLIALYSLLAIGCCSLSHLAFTDRYTRLIEPDFDQIGEIYVDDCGAVEGSPVFYVKPRPFADGDGFLANIVEDLSERYPEYQFEAEAHPAVTAGYVANMLHECSCHPSYSFLGFTKSPSSGKIKVDFVGTRLTPGEVKCADMEMDELAKRSAALAEVASRLSPTSEITKGPAMSVLQAGRHHINADEEHFLGNVRKEELFHMKCQVFLEELLLDVMHFLCQMQERHPELHDRIEAIMSTPTRDLEPDVLNEFAHLIAKK